MGRTRWDVVFRTAAAATIPRAILEPAGISCPGVGAFDGTSDGSTDGALDGAGQGSDPRTI